MWVLSKIKNRFHCSNVGIFTKSGVFSKIKIEAKNVHCSNMGVYIQCLYFKTYFSEKTIPFHEITACRVQPLKTLCPEL